MVALRQMLIQPYRPDETENLGDDTAQYASSDIGKAVKYADDAMVQCASGDDIVGVVQSINPGTTDGYSVGGVRKEGRAWVLDEAGTLTIGATVVAGTAGTLGTLANANAIAGPGALYKWVVIRLDGSGAGRAALIQKV